MSNNNWYAIKRAKKRKAEKRKAEERARELAAIEERERALAEAALQVAEAARADCTRRFAAVETELATVIQLVNECAESPELSELLRLVKSARYMVIQAQRDAGIDANIIGKVPRNKQPVEVRRLLNPTSYEKPKVRSAQSPINFQRDESMTQIANELNSRDRDLYSDD